MTRRGLLVAAWLVWIAIAVGCFPVLPSKGGGQTEFSPPRVADPADVAVPDGYRVEIVAEGLTFPTDVEFDEQGRLYVLEAGYSYGEVITTPRLLRMIEGGGTQVVAEGENGPWNGMTYHEGAFYIGGGTLEAGYILRVEPEGEARVLVGGLPSVGDHHTNGPVVGPDGLLYFGQGTATNSGIVGTDNADFGWLHRYPDFHDVPCEDVTLAGINYRSENPLTDSEGDEVTTGAYLPFGTSSERGQVVEGALPCGGSVMRVGLDGSNLELVAWGLRNPFGLAFAPDGGLFVVNNSYDERGSRPVFGTGDLLWRVEPGTWYGWPDYHGTRPLTDDEHFQSRGEDAPGFLLAVHPNIPPRPVAVLGVHSSSNGIDFSDGAGFGYQGQAFIAQFGDMAPGVGKVLEPVGFRVVRVDIETGVIEDFAINRDPRGPASRVGSAGLERPVSVAFDPQNAALYVVDFGVMTIGEQGPVPVPGTGVLWRIVPTGAPEAEK